MPHRNNMRRVAGVCITIVLLALLILGGLACFYWGRSTANNDNSERTNRLGGCRASYRAALVDVPTFGALAAAGTGDQAGVAKAIGNGDVAEYQGLLQLSQTDPDAFLDRCERDGYAGNGG